MFITVATNLKIPSVVVVVGGVVVVVVVGVATKCHYSRSGVTITLVNKT